MHLENYLKNPIPFGEACAFLVEFHKLGSEMEGVAAPPPDALSLYAAVAQAEFKSIFAYTVYGQTLRDLARGSLADEFQQHADDELEHAEWVLRRMAVLGGQPPLQDVPAPLPASDPLEVIQNIIQIEQEGIAAWQALHAALGEDPAKYKVEEYLAVEQEHLDDMLRLLPAQPPAPMAEPAAPQAPMGEPGAPLPAAPAASDGASVKVDLKPGGDKTASMQKTGFAERLLPGTEGYYSNRMLSVLQGLPPKVFTPEGALDGVEKTAEGVDGVVPLLLGLAAGFGVGKNVAGETAAALAPQGRVGRSENIAKHLATIGAPVGSLAGYAALPPLANKAAKLLPNSELGQSLKGAVQLGAPMVGGILGGMLGGVLSGAGVAGVQQLRGPLHNKKDSKTEEKHAAAFKRAADELMAAQGELPPQQGTQAGSQLQADPRTSAFLQNEMEGQEAQQQNEAEFYKQRFAEAQQQLEAATQASEQAAAQAQQLQQQAEQNQMALSSAQSQSQQATALAMQQVMQAGDEKLQQQMQAAQMRMAYQDLRGQLMGLAAQEPPAQVLADPATGAPGGQPAPGDPSMGGVAAPAGQPQDAASAPAGQAPEAPLQPGQPGPGGEQAPTEGATPAEPAGKGKGATSVTVKQGSFRDHALGAGLGALIGGAGTALEATHGGGLRDGLQKKISVLEQEQGSFPQAMRLVANKALLGASEAASKHPVGASIVGSLAGAGIGAATEPAVRSLMESGRRLLG